jgi:cell division septum initiation protein DivIVA
MSGEKKFGTSTFGFNKSDVNAYIEKIIHEFDQRLKEKDDEISNLKLQIREMKVRFDTASNDSESLLKEKERIATALITAQEKADAVIQEARARAADEKKMLESALESDREKIIDIKRDIKQMKNLVAEALGKYQTLLSDADAYIENKEQEYNIDSDREDQ